MASQGRLYGCPVEVALDLIGGKWKTIILARLKEGALRYSELRRSIPELSDKVLTQRLRELEDAGLIARTEAAGQARYEVTARGASLGPALDALFHFGEAEGAAMKVRYRHGPDA